jgi:hypothetical protein
LDRWVFNHHFGYRLSRSFFKQLQKEGHHNLMDLMHKMEVNSGSLKTKGSGALFF